MKKKKYSIYKQNRWTWFISRKKHYWLSFIRPIIVLKIEKFWTVNGQILNLGKCQIFQESFQLKFWYAIASIASDGFLASSLICNFFSSISCTKALVFFISYIFNQFPDATSQYGRLLLPQLYKGLFSIKSVISDVY